MYNYRWEIPSNDAFIKDVINENEALIKKTDDIKRLGTFQGGKIGFFLEVRQLSVGMLRIVILLLVFKLLKKLLRVSVLEMKIILSFGLMLMGKIIQRPI